MTEPGLEQRGPSFSNTYREKTAVRPDYPSDRLIIPDDLDFAARADFTTDASRVIEHAHALIEVDCSKITVIDPPTIGMLVWITRNAKRRGISVVLDSASEALMVALDAAGVADRFATPG